MTLAELVNRIKTHYIAATFRELDSGLFDSTAVFELGGCVYRARFDYRPDYHLGRLFVDDATFGYRDTNQSRRIQYVLETNHAEAPDNVR